MNKTKEELLKEFRQYMDSKSIEINGTKKKEDASKLVNTLAKDYREKLLKQLDEYALRTKLDIDTVINNVLLITYVSYIIMLEYRNNVWKYEYMSFSRRIGELWEPFCKIPFYYRTNDVKILKPLLFEKVKNDKIEEYKSLVDKLEISDSDKIKLEVLYKHPWDYISSGEVKLDLDLHFKKGNICYNCDFKSGFSSNEKGNTNRLLLVGCIYRSLGDNQKAIIFVRQEEEANNHYLQTLINSKYWDVYCGNECYKMIEEFTKFNLRKWLDENANWAGDCRKEFRDYLSKQDLLKYLTW